MRVEIKNYQCPKCKKKIPLDIRVLIFNRNLETICKNCGEQLKAKKPIKWNVGFLIGFISFGIPAQLILFFKRDFLLAASVGLLSATILIVLFILYIYKTTEFIED